MGGELGARSAVQVAPFVRREQEAREHDDLDTHIGIRIEEIRQAERDAAGGKVTVTDEIPARIARIRRHNQRRLTWNAIARRPAMDEEMTRVLLSGFEQRRKRASAFERRERIERQRAADESQFAMRTREFLGCPFRIGGRQRGDGEESVGMLLNDAGKLIVERPIQRPKLFDRQTRIEAERDGVRQELALNSVAIEIRDSRRESRSRESKVQRWTRAVGARICARMTAPFAILITGPAR